MAKYRVKVKMVVYDWLIVEADNEAQIEEVVNGQDQDGNEVFQERHEAAWNSGEASDGPEDGCSVLTIIPLTK